MRDLNDVFHALQQSSFRRKFHLNAGEQKYLHDKGAKVIRQHAEDFVRKRLADAAPVKDGKQTPWRGHPVFVAQHACGVCCRGCMEKWHYIKRGKALREEEVEYVVNVIMKWLATENGENKE